MTLSCGTPGTDDTLWRQVSLHGVAYVARIAPCHDCSHTRRYPSNTSTWRTFQTILQVCTAVLEGVQCLLFLKVCARPIHLEYSTGGIDR